MNRGNLVKRKANEVEAFGEGLQKLDSLVVMKIDTFHWFSPPPYRPLPTNPQSLLSKPFVARAFHCSPRPARDV